MNFNSYRHWKAALTLIAVLSTFATYSNTAVVASSCSMNCLSVYSIALTDAGTSIKGTIKLIDDEGTAGGARSAVVHVVWTRPDGSALDQYDVISTRLRAEFSLYTAGAPGRYTLTVVDVTKSGYTFNPASSSTRSESITVGTAGNLPPTAVANADQVSMSFKKRTKAVNAIVIFVDENGNRVRDAGVYAVWTVPGGSKIEQFGDTRTRSRAKFTLIAQTSGIYTLTVVEMSKDGYVFDPDNSNVLSGMIDVDF